MASLVADYGSDEDSADDEETSVLQNNLNPNSVPAPDRNYLISGDKDDSDSNQEEEKYQPCGKVTEGNNSKRLPNPLLEKLPSPDLDSDLQKGVQSVFSNPFEKAEIAKNSILERHVKMTEKQVKEGKNVKICWKFKKGRCPFGKNCKYSHDLDSHLTYPKETVESENQSTSAEAGIPAVSFPQFNQRFMNNYQDQPQKEDDDNYMASAKRKKRAGLAPNLVPPKKAMQALQQQRKVERPWTVNKE
ncbi:hypothetical protein ACJMK2_012465 [Sinanodonta woodiana]|uniref:C3H1-type domain-containing protein n=1 Tax=Sinanodonta woodiana TaxID=1069815 RepID=A0ABD3V8A2_SINWO